MASGNEGGSDSRSPPTLESVVSAATVHSYRSSSPSGSAASIRAVASSCTHCWLSFAVPCHRVLHKSGVRQAQRDPQARRRLKWLDYEAALLAEPGKEIGRAHV